MSVCVCVCNIGEYYFYFEQYEYIDKLGRTYTYKIIIFEWVWPGAEAVVVQSKRNEIFSSRNPWYNIIFWHNKSNAET